MGKKESNVLDVARYILEKAGDMTAMKLEKLVYYCQAWSLVWDDRPLFADRIEAWANGPVSPRLFKAHRGKYQVSAQDIGGCPDRIDKDGTETIDSVLKFYGKYRANFLRGLTHMEDPWKDAREGLALGERGNREITHAAMSDYYEGLAS